MAYPAKAVANEFLTHAKLSGDAISPMKLQKLVYFAHGWYLALAEAPLIEETVQAWRYGPVIPTLYREFKGFGNSSIDEFAREIDFENLQFKTIEPRIVECGDDPDAANALAVIRKVWQTYGKHSAVQLSNATHADGTPWQRTYVEGARALEIPNEVIRDYFLDLKDRARSRHA